MLYKFIAILFIKNLIFEMSSNPRDDGNVCYRSVKRVNNHVKGYDGFGVPVTLNFDGEDTFKTTPGGLISLFLYVQVLCYAIVQI